MRFAGWPANVQPDDLSTCFLPAKPRDPSVSPRWTCQDDCAVSIEPETGCRLGPMSDAPDTLELVPKTDLDLAATRALELEAALRERDWEFAQEQCLRISVEENNEKLRAWIRAHAGDVPSHAELHVEFDKALIAAHKNGYRMALAPNKNPAIMEGPSKARAEDDSYEGG